MQLPLWIMNVSSWLKALSAFFHVWISGLQYFECYRVRNESSSNKWKSEHVNKYEAGTGSRYVNRLIARVRRPSHQLITIDIAKFEMNAVDAN